MDALSGLKDALPPGRVATGAGELERHAGAVFTCHDPNPPDAVVFPETREEVARVLRFADERGVPVVPFGEGRSLEAQTVPLRGGISLDLRSMDGIVERARRRPGLRARHQEPRGPGRDHEPG